MASVSCVDPARALCGEGLIWDAARQCLWWVDIAGETLHRFDPETGAAQPTPMPYLISALALRDDDALLIATGRGLGIVDPATVEIKILHHPEPDKPGNRLNDMISGPDGALWVGTMSEGAKGATGALYRYDARGAAPVMTGTTISNGLGWSPDSQRLYFVDSVPGTLHVREGGTWREFLRFDDSLGKPDGLTVDAEGTIWVAICDRGHVLGLRPDATVCARIEVPCPIVTNCAFGGPDLKTLYVTTGTFSMSDAERAENPEAGGLFAIDMDVPGMLQHKARWPHAVLA